MAEKLKHTPGPWGYEDPMGPDILTIVANPEAEVYDWIWVAQIGTEPVEDEDGSVRDKRTFAEHEANARLIAAAPDLLEVAMRILERGYVSEHIEEERGDHLALVAAIAKATGRAALNQDGGA